LNVSADPRLVKQLLLSQWMNAANPLETKNPNDAGENSLFGVMLNGLLNGSSLDELLPVDASDNGWMLNGSAAGSLSLYGVGGPGSTGTAYGESNRTYDELISSAASRYGIDPALIKAVVQTESGFDPNAVSSAGAKGLMQLMDDTARGLGVNDSFDPVQNIDGGTRFLSYLLRKYDGNLAPALAAYNAGPGRVDRLGLTTDEQVGNRIDELPEETQRYIRKVLTAVQHWNGQL